MPQKIQIKATLPSHISADIKRRSVAVSLTPSEYLAGIAKWWYSEGSPPIDKAEVRLRAEKQ